MKIEVFIQKQYGGYIAGYSFHNGYRIVSHYVKSFYNNKYSFTLDYLHARHYSRETATKHAKAISNAIKERDITI